LSTRLFLHDQPMPSHYLHYNGTRFINVDLSRFPKAVHRMNDTDKQEFVKLFLERQKALKALNTSRLWHGNETLTKREQAFEAIEAKCLALASKYPAP